MSVSKIETTDDVYRFVERLKSECQEHGATELSLKLDDALCLGSSGLEILGAIRHTIISNLTSVERLLGVAGKDEANQVIGFVDKAFGR